MERNRGCLVYDFMLFLLFPHLFSLKGREDTTRLQAQKSGVIIDASRRYLFVSCTFRQPRRSRWMAHALNSEEKKNCSLLC
jgi:hypothetical protein